MKFKIYCAIMLALVSSVASAVNKKTFDPTATPLSVVIPFAPGGGVDIAFRHLQRYADQRKITLIPVYKPGAEGSIAMSELETGDRKTVGLATSGVVAYYRLKEPNNSLTILTGIRTSVMAMVTSSNNNIKTLEDLNKQVALNTETNFGYGAPTQHMIINQYLARVGAVSGQNVVPYKGAGPVIKDLIGNHIDVAVVPLSVAITQIESDKLTLLAIASGTSDLYSAPVLAKIFTNWRDFDGMLVVTSKNTDSDVVKFWEQFLQEYLNDVSVQKEVAQDHSVSMQYGTTVIESIVSNNIEQMRK